MNVAPRRVSSAAEWNLGQEMPTFVATSQSKGQGQVAYEKDTLVLARFPRSRLMWPSQVLARYMRKSQRYVLRCLDDLEVVVEPVGHENVRTYREEDHAAVNNWAFNNEGFPCRYKNALDNLSTYFINEKFPPLSEHCKAQVDKYLR